MLAPIIVLLAFAAPWTHAAIAKQFDCTAPDNTGAFKYTRDAVACDNSPQVTDATCELLFGTAVKVNTDTERPDKCFRKSANDQTDPDIVSAATELCPKTCGYCCKSSAYTCTNKPYPRVTCDSMAHLCRDTKWREILSEDCPATCGLCNEGGCVDIVVGCASDPTICVTLGMEDFVNKNCRRTCGRCGASTPRAPGTPGCTSFPADSSTSCRYWAANGFCTKDFYTVVERRKHCATTCRIC